MGDKLDEIFKLQKNLEKMMSLDRYPKDTQGNISALCTDKNNESVELQRTSSWKWWI